MKTNTYIFYIGMLCCMAVAAPSLFAQQAPRIAELYARPYGDSVALRWQLYDYRTWKSGITRGYDLYRITPGSSRQEKLNDSAIKALNPEQWALRYSVINEKDTTITFTDKIDTLSATAMGLQFPEETNFNFNLPPGDGMIDFGNNPDAVRFLFHSITCLYSKEASIVSGLYFTDRKVQRGQPYEYVLVMSGDPLSRAIARTTVSPSASYLIRQPSGMSDYTHRRRAFLSWNKADTTGVFIPVYDLYRSESKDKGYVKINKDPILAVIENSSRLDSNKVTFRDSTLLKGRSYYYKVHGKDLFGEYTSWSEPWLVTEKTFIEQAPAITEGSAVHNRYNRIAWTVDSSEEENVNHFYLYRSEYPDSLYQPLSKKLDRQVRSYEDKEPLYDSYYKLMTVGNARDTVWSTPRYIHIPDSIPPSAPQIITGICDSSGLVMLKWKHGGEKDLKGFKIFKANYLNEEFSGIRTIERLDTIFSDTVNLHSLSEEIFYKIMAYDKTYNLSPFSNIIRVKKPDTIPPSSPVFYQVRSDSAGIQLTWGNSSSRDVVKTILFRRLREESAWHEYKVYARDTVRYTTFRDTAVYRGQWYEYALCSFDDDRNRSDFSQPVHLRAFDNGFRPEIKDIRSKADKRRGIVKLSWKYSQPGVEHFQLFRGENGGPVTILTSLPAGTIEFYDRDLRSGKRYSYRIRAVFKDGASSPLSRELVFEF